MFKSLKLRWKILVAMVGLSVIPLAVTLLIFSRLTEAQIDRDLQSRVESVASFVKRTASHAKRENANYIQLLSANPELVNAVYFAPRLEDTTPIEKALSNAHELFDFDLIEVFDPEGGLLVRSLADEALELPSTTGGDHPVIRSSLEGTTSADTSIFDGKLAIVASSPVLLQGNQIGHLVGVEFLDSEFAEQVEALSGAEVAFYGRDEGIFAASGAELEGIDLQQVLDGGLTETVLADRIHALYTTDLGQDQGILVALDSTDALEARDEVREVLLIILIVVTALAVLIGLAISHGIVRPLTRVVEHLREISQGEADLTRTLDVSTRDEVGELAESFNAFLRRLREMVLRTRSVSSDLTGATEKVRTSFREVAEGAHQQSRSFEESHQAIQGIEESVSGIAESTGSLVDAAEESSSATLELGATIEEIASQMEKLFMTVEEVSSSISEMSVSSKQIAENVEILSSSTEVTASSITELDASIKEIEENAERTNLLSEEAAEDARQGMDAVNETIEGIGAVREMVDRASRAIQELGSQSSAIGKILTVIDEVADQTSLLALNAAIIAAQAGEHGKGFAVVADEIRELAERTAVSTKEIAAIINNLQSGTQDAVKAMSAGSERVHQEAERSKIAGKALDKIRTSTLKSTEQVRGIVRATQEQSRGSQQITNSINEVASMLGQIAAAIKQQSEGTQQLARAAESMKEIASQGKLSTGEQAKGSRQINASMERIRTMIERIDAATREQTERSRQVVEAVSRVRDIAESNASRTAEMDQVVKILTKQTGALEGEVGAFKV